MTTMTIQEQAAQLVADERKRQVGKGFGAAHDDQWRLGQLASAAEAYVHAAVVQAAPQYINDTVGLPQLGLPACWPCAWDEYWFQPEDDRLRTLIKAGALLMAEIERELRAREKESQP